MQTPAQRLAAYRTNQTEEQREERLRKNRERMAASRLEESDGQRQQRLDTQRNRQATIRENTTEIQRQERRNLERARQVTQRANATESQRQQRRVTERESQSTRRANATEIQRQQRREAERASQAIRRTNATESQRQQRRETERASQVVRRANATESQRQQRREIERESQVVRRSNATESQHQQRREIERESQIVRRANATEEEQQQRRDRERARHRASFNSAQWHRGAFKYDKNYNYKEDKIVLIGEMNKECKYCSAKRFEGEPKGICCAEGKVSIQCPKSPPEPLNTLLAASTPEANDFRKNIRAYNSAFQMTSPVSRVSIISMLRLCYKWPWIAFCTFPILHAGRISVYPSTWAMNHCSPNSLKELRVFFLIWEFCRYQFVDVCCMDLIFQPQQDVNMW